MAKISAAFKGMASRCRRGQTAVEYLLVTVALTIGFAAIYPAVQALTRGQFKKSAVAILSTYK